MKKLFILFAFILMVGCATHPDKIHETYVSSINYQNHSCEELNEEMEHVTRKSQELHASLSKLANDDSVQMGIGLILFWPALLFLEGGDGREASEYARLKGDMNAIHEMSSKKNCKIAEHTSQ